MTYEDEISGLIARYRQQSVENIDIRRRERKCISIIGKDSPLCFILPAYSRQFHRLALELQEKYGKITTDGLIQLEEYRITAEYDDGEHSLSEWIKPKILEYLEVIEKEVEQDGGRKKTLPLGAILSHDYDEYIRKLQELRVKA